jgi:cytochrome c556
MLKFASLVLLAVAASLTLTACSGEAKDTHPDQPVTKRRAILKQFTKTLEPMGLVARGRATYNPREMNLNALELQKLSTQPWLLFTADSNYPPTRAKPAVWSQPTEFKAAQQDYQVKVGELVKASQRGDLDAVKASLNAVEKSCKTCHTQFRNDSAS